MSDFKNENLPFTIIFGKVKTKRSNYFGLFTVILQNSNMSLESASAAFSIYSEVHTLGFDDGWYAFEQKIQDMIYSGDLAPTVSMTTQDSLREEFRLPEFIKGFYEYLKRNDQDEIKKLLHDFFDTVLHDEISIDYQCINITAEQLAEGRVREEKNNPVTPEQDQTVIVRSKLVIAPVGGKLVTELKTGDQIMVSLLPGPRENQYISELNLQKDNGQIKPVAARVAQVKEIEKGVQITGQILENVYTILNEEEKVLVKLFAPQAKDEPKASAPAQGAPGSARPKASSSTQKKGGSAVFLIGMTLLVLLLLGLGYILISG